ncbi:hypothetical protein FUA48_10855 [Flavobacterium alkalisoli]|uniref:DUF3592 domain-containing protein n=1 Tax=Flavobacterium alkalisoli TaxID=2602769 RepID=A0A5B9FUV5_9FLAO|nr:hypothetical protein [Flavobacterium alkalisoli]QEE50059.1 hypothetical protein FUA48_10855 [Flavobacterium alkalisoli]
MKNQIGFPVFFNLVKGNKLFWLGLLFTVLGILVTVPLYLFMGSIVEPHEKYNHELIYDKGTEKEAVVNNISVKFNVTYNNQHPVQVSYSYIDNGKEVHDKFETLDLNNQENMFSNLHKTLKIKVYNGQSAIVGLEPFVFPYSVFMTFFIFPFIGLIMLIIGMWPGFKIYRVYKNGEEREAQIYAVMPVSSGIVITNRKASVDYHYFSKNGNKLLGHATAPIGFLANNAVNDTVSIYVSADDETKSYLSPKYLMRKY